MAGLALLVSFFALQVAEAGGGSHYSCDMDKKVSQTYDGPALEVTVRDSCFGPVIARVEPGTELRWVNRGQLPHNLTEVNDPMTVRAMQPNGSVTMKFDRPGAFVYYCGFHPGMTGAVFVGDSLADSDPQVTNAEPVAKKAPPLPATSPSIARVETPARGYAGVSTLTVVLLALAIGTLAGGGSTLLVNRLGRR